MQPVGVFDGQEVRHKGEKGQEQDKIWVLINMKNEIVFPETENPEEVD